VSKPGFKLTISQIQIKEVAAKASSFNKTAHNSGYTSTASNGCMTVNNEGKELVPVMICCMRLLIFLLYNRFCLLQVTG
jgi:hypothetical protein